MHSSFVYFDGEDNDFYNDNDDVYDYNHDYNNIVIMIMRNTEIHTSTCVLLAAWAFAITNH